MSDPRRCGRSLGAALAAAGLLCVAASPAAGTGVGKLRAIFDRMLSEGISVPWVVVSDRIVFSSTAKIVGASGSISRGRVDLVDGVATTVATIALPPGTSCGGMFNYSLTASDATDQQVVVGVCRYAAANKGGVYTSDVKEEQANDTRIHIETTALTDMTDVRSVVAGVNEVAIRVNANTGLTPTSLRATFQLQENTTQEVTVP